MKKEKSHSRLYKRIVKADFKPGESVQSSVFRGVQYVKPRDYLTGGKVLRIMERLWYWFVLLLFGFATFVLTTGSGVIYKRLTEMQAATAIVTGLAVFGIWLFSIYMTLLSQAYLRWMYRNRKNKLLQ